MMHQPGWGRCHFAKAELPKEHDDQIQDLDSFNDRVLCGFPGMGNAVLSGGLARGRERVDIG